MTEPVVITGLGVVCALGSSRDEVAAAARRGTRAFAPVRLFDASAFRVDLAAEAPALDVAGRFGARTAARSSRTDALALWAAADALAQSGLPAAALATAGLLVGASSGGMEGMEAVHAQAAAAPLERYWAYPIWMTANTMARRLGIGGQRATYMTACSSSAHALGIAMRRLRAGELHVAVAGGAESLCRLTLSGFGALGVLDPRGTRPFDAARAGITLGEGAAFFVLESGSHARRRGARPLAVLAGYGAVAEAHHMVHPLDDGSGALATMQAALADAGLDAALVDYINAHGTGTVPNDLMEARAMSALVGPRRVRVSSSKSMLGHTLGAAAALEAAVTVLGMEHGFVPPSAGVTARIDALGDLDLVTEAVSTAPQVALSSSFAFGGNDAALVLVHPEAAVLERHVRPHAVEVSARRPRRVVVTAAAVTCPRGVAADPEALVSLLERLEPGGAELSGLDPGAVLGRGAIRRMDALSAAAAALYSLTAKSAGLTDLSRGGIGFGTSFGALDATVAFLSRLFEKGPHLVNPMEFPSLVHNAPAGQIAILLRARGPNLAASQEELSGDEVLRALCDLVAAGEIDAALAGGGDLGSEWMERGYARIDRVLRTSSSHASVLGVVALESEANAKARGKQPMARVLGLGAAGQWSGVEGAIGRALEQAAAAGHAVERLDLWYRGATEPLGLEQETRAARLPLVATAMPVDARLLLGDAAGAGPAVVGVAAAAIALGRAESVLVTSVTRDGCAQAALLGAVS